MGGVGEHLDGGDGLEVVVLVGGFEVGYVAVGGGLVGGLEGGGLVKRITLRILLIAIKSIPLHRYYLLHLMPTLPPRGNRRQLYIGRLARRQFIRPRPLNRRPRINIPRKQEVLLTLIRVLTRRLRQNNLLLMRLRKYTANAFFLQFLHFITTQYFISL